jgi:hypothetical protein
MGVSRIKTQDKELVLITLLCVVIGQHGGFITLKTLFFPLFATRVNLRWHL